ncbi:MAG: transcriptional repressor LexA [Spirochaetes bacterium]|uniref:LexA repressor n=1 Tax=Candidatus Gallitreponema excrementavium TaxID=2840840 RepID=A0A9D9HR42_9SPIR|nr:transcriptional repressor LexA [Candidatus Gallitreponema excrementavium]
MRDLTERQKEILDFICKYIGENSFPPTIREIAGKFGITAKGAYDHVTALQKKNVIKFSNNKSRTIEIVEKESEQGGNVTSIPLLGTIAAGLPILSEENIEKMIPVAKSMLRTGKNYFALKVRGDSMIEAGILEGDIAIIESCTTCENGEIVVAVIEDSITLKRFYKETNRVKLQPENKNYKTLYYQNIRIAGRLKGLIRTYK